MRQSWQWLWFLFWIWWIWIPVEHISENNNYVIGYMGESLRETISPSDKFWKHIALKKHNLPGQLMSIKQRHCFLQVILTIHCHLFLNQFYWGIILEKEMAIHSIILAWRTPWTEDHGVLHSTGLQSQRWLRDAKQLKNYIPKGNI